MEIVLPSSSGNDTYRYTVTSYQLCACSSVFRAMLGPKSSFAEAVELRRRYLLESDSPDPDRLYQLNVKDHDPTALAAVLSVLHVRTENLPDEIPFEGLLQVAIICDYYDCAAVMRPWDDMWMKKWKGCAQTPGYESWLFIAQVFKEKTIFRNLSKRFVRKSIIEDGEFKVLVSDSPNRVVKSLDRHTSEGVMGWTSLNSTNDGAHCGTDTLLKQRGNICREVVKIYREVYDRYEDNTKIHCTYSSPSELCDYFIFGELHKGLKSAGFLTEVVHHHWTPEHLVSAVGNVFETIFDHLNIPVRFDGQDHYKCFSFRKEFIDRMKSLLEEFETVPISLKSAVENIMVKERVWVNLLLARDKR